eukprot:TRINITY_DN7818_c0_g1_i2.p2 TRINITY_DN7818_c0_g1~~TRINITY_DN7818_c0_g1_i2.p2  ORF type:complete len:115 (-),score=20.98 TRINITY_DN7818_c0_g1_i2:59-403(-)
MKAHYESAHRDNPLFVCQVEGCNRKFPYRNMLWMHLKEDHEGTRKRKNRSSEGSAPKRKRIGSIKDKLLGGMYMSSAIERPDSFCLEPKGCDESSEEDQCNDVFEGQSLDNAKD